MKKIKILVFASLFAASCLSVSVAFAKDKDCVTVTKETTRGDVTVTESTTHCVEKNN